MRRIFSYKSYLVVYQAVRNQYNIYSAANKLLSNCFTDKEAIEWVDRHIRQFNSLKLKEGVRHTRRA